VDITLSLGLNNFAPAGSGADWPDLVERARRADEAGIDRLWVVDHVVMGEHLDAYDGGAFPTGPDGDWLEPLTLLGVLAGATTRARLATGVLQAALRRPVVLAKAAASLDVLSGGRLDLGVGVGWQREEYEAAGLDFDRRGALLDETLRLCRTLWGGEPVTGHADAGPFGPVWCRPVPAQAGGVPIWISGRMRERTLRRIVELGAGWIPWATDASDLAAAVDRVHAALVDAGRETTSFQVRGSLAVRLDHAGRSDPIATVEPVPALVGHGITDFQLVIPAGARAEVDAALPELVGAFRARVAFEVGR
jgi:probable F420-dependent oxidoreductase